MNGTAMNEMTFKYVLYSSKWGGFLVKFAPKRTETGAKLVAVVNQDPAAGSVMAWRDPAHIEDQLMATSAAFGMDPMAEPFGDFVWMAIPDKADAEGLVEIPSPVSEEVSND